jgi:uncharacterized protein YpmB
MIDIKKHRKMSIPIIIAIISAIALVSATIYQEFDKQKDRKEAADLQKKNEAA